MWVKQKRAAATTPQRGNSNHDPPTIIYAGGDLLSHTLPSAVPSAGKEATEIGLATWAVDTEDAALELSKEKLAQLATRSPDQLAATKRLFRDVHRSPRSTFRAERTQQLLLLARKNTAIIRNAAMKKVSPKFARRGMWARG
ncbi:hypothetical protein [Corynebacterium amycolatum]